MFKTLELFDLTHTEAGNYLAKYLYPWEAVGGISDLIFILGRALGREYDEVSPSVWVHKSVKIAPTAHIGAPAILGAGTEVRQCAFIRGSALVGRDCVIGNSTELKNVILFDGVQTPHFNYVGDSILGYKAHLGAGVITSNVKCDKSLVTVNFGEKNINTRLKKLGAMIGDFAEIGCNSVLNPGTVVGRNSIIYPLSCVRGAVPADSIFKHGGEITNKR